MRTRINSGGWPEATYVFETTMAALIVWFMCGAYLDAWSHQHFPKETFFTPWHGILYTAGLALTVFLVTVFAHNVRRGYPLRQALPRGYGLSLAGCWLFLVGGGLDMAWHLLLGVEYDLSRLVSPTHLLLGTATALIVCGPLRAAIRRPTAAAGLPVLSSAWALLCLFTFFTQFAHPFIDPWPATRLDSWSAGSPLQANYQIAVEVISVLAILLQTCLLIAVVLILMRRFTLRFGSITFLAGFNAAVLAPLHDHPIMVVVGLVGGFIADLLIICLRPSLERTWAVRTIAFAVPSALYLVYFLSLFVTGGVWWPVPLWMGTVLLAGMVGWLISYAVFAPSMGAAPTRSQFQKRNGFPTGRAVVILSSNDLLTVQPIGPWQVWVRDSGRDVGDKLPGLWSLTDLQRLESAR